MSNEETEQEILDRLQEIQKQINSIETKFDRKSRMMDEIYKKLKGGQR